MFSLFRGNATLECGSSITNSSITNSTIDMGGNRITNVGDPIDGKDAVNKDYVDNLILNGNPGIPNDVITHDITLVNDDFILVSCVLDGDLYIMVKNLVSGGPSANFQTTKGTYNHTASPARLSSSSGLTTGEKLEIQWLPGGGVQLRKTGLNYDGLYRLRIIQLSTFTLCDTGELGNQIEIITMPLTGINYTLIDCILSGDLIVWVKNLVVDGPSAHFHITKSEQDRYPSVVRVTSDYGTTTGEHLQLRWNPFNGLELGKDGLNYDGNYKIRIFRNITDISCATPSSGTDITTLTIGLTGTNYSNVISDTSGTMFVSVKNVVTDGPSSHFQISKSESSQSGDITRLTNSFGATSLEYLELRWLSGSGVELRKTGINYDGNYQIKIIKNS